MRNLCVKMYAKLLNAKENFLRDETGAVDIVAIVILIGVAVALAALFKTQITTLLTTLLEKITKSANDVVN